MQLAVVKVASASYFLYEKNMKKYSSIKWSTRKLVVAGGIVACLLCLGALRFEAPLSALYDFSSVPPKALTINFSSAFPTIDTSALRNLDTADDTKAFPLPLPSSLPPTPATFLTIDSSSPQKTETLPNLNEQNLLKPRSKIGWKPSIFRLGLLESSEQHHPEYRLSEYESTTFTVPQWCSTGQFGNDSFTPDASKWINVSVSTSRLETGVCFGEYRGIDYNSGREFDLFELRGGTLPQCLEACHKRNKMLWARSAALERHRFREVIGQNVDVQRVRESMPDACAAAVYNNYSKQCWLKRKGPLMKRLADTTTFILSSNTYTLLRPRSVDEHQELSTGASAITSAGDNSHRATITELRDRINRSSRNRRRASRSRPELSVLYAVLSEHQYVKQRMIPALMTWLKEEDVMVLLVRSTLEEMRSSESLLAPYLAYRANPGTVRVIEYLVRNSLKDLNPQSSARERTDRFQHDNNAARLARRDFFQKGPVESVQQLLSRYQLNNKQWDQGEYRLARDSGAWKDLPGIQVVFRRFSNYSFYMMIDDDSYIIQRNFEILLSSFYVNHFDPWNVSVYAGVLSLWYQPITANRATVTPFVQGGAGILMSHAAMAAAYPKIRQCRFTCDYLPHGDVRLGCCMKKVVNIQPIFETTFWHMHIYRAQGRDARHLRSMFPVSFHRMKNDSMLYPLHVCATADEARMQAANISRAFPVTWDAVLRCYQWMRNTSEHEYKFQMNDLH